MSRLGTASYRRTENVQHYPESHTYITPVGNYGHPPAVMSMGNMASALPSYTSGQIQFDQRSMQQQQQQQQQFVPVAPNPGLVYGMPQPQSFPTPTTNPNMMFGAPYPQMYMPYVQQQQRHPGTHLSDASGFSPIPPPTPRPGSAQGSMDAYGQGYFNPNVYKPTQDHYPRPATTSTASPQPQSQSYMSTPKPNEDREKEDQRRITIVDGSTHMRSSAAQGSSAGKQATSPWLVVLILVRKLTVVIIFRFYLTSTKIKHAKRTVEKTETIRQCSVGWESRARNQYRRTQGLLLAGCHK